MLLFHSLGGAVVAVRHYSLAALSMSSIQGEQLEVVISKWTSSFTWLWKLIVYSISLAFMCLVLYQSMEMQDHDVNQSGEETPTHQMKQNDKR